MRQPASHRFSLHAAGPVTKGLCAALLVVSLVGAVTQRTLGVGVLDLIFEVDAVLSGQVWRLVTHPFAATDLIGLLLGGFMLWMLGQSFEAQWGSRDYLQFFVASSVGAAIVAIPLGFAINRIGLFVDVGASGGPWAAVDALFVAMALLSPTSNVLFGFVLPMKARTIVYVILGFELIRGIQTGASGLSMTLGAMAMGYLLVTGNWRPNHWLRRKAKRRRGLYVVPPRDKTLH